MVIESIVAAIFIAFGILLIMFSVEHGINDKQTMGVLILGILSSIAGGWIFFTFITLEFVIAKIVGVLMLLVGGFLIFGFPDASQHQRPEFSN